MKSLRPVGSEFWSEGFIDESTGNNFSRRFKYRVVRHGLGLRFAHSSSPTIPIAELEPIEEQHADVLGYDLKLKIPVLGEWYTV